MEQVTNNTINAVNALLIAPDTPDHLVKAARKFRKMLFAYLENLRIKQTSINFAASTEGAVKVNDDGTITEINDVYTV